MFYQEKGRNRLRMKLSKEVATAVVVTNELKLIPAILQQVLDQWHVS